LDAVCCLSRFDISNCESSHQAWPHCVHEYFNVVTECSGIQVSYEAQVMISAPLSLLVLYKLPLATAGLKKKSVPNFASKFPYHVILRRFIKYLLQRVIEPFLCLIYIILISNTEFLNRDVTPPTSQYLTWQFNTTKLCSIIYYGQNFRLLLVNPLIFHTKMSNHLLVQCNACLT